MFSRWLDRAGAFLVIVGDVVDAVTYRIAVHLTGVEGFKKFGDLYDVLHPRIKPKVVGVGVEDYRHSVVDS